MRLAIVILSVLVCRSRLTLKIETGFFPKLKLSPKSRKNPVSQREDSRNRVFATIPNYNPKTPKNPVSQPHPKPPETGFLRQYLTTTQNLRKTRFLSLTQNLQKPGFCDNT